MNSTSLTNTINAPRIQSIDILRGLVIVLMALDHVRDFFHHDAFIFLPTDPEKTTVALFATRWITHICAPIFAWLTGVSAWIYYHKKGSANTSIFLISRGLILIVLEFTVIRFAWHFRFDYPNLGMLVIWALGFSMVVLGILQFLQQKYVFVLGVLIILLHNFLDDISFGNQEIEGLLWHVLHESGKVTMSNGMTINVLYPALPVIGLMCIGFGMGTLFTEDTKEERIAVLKKLSYVSLLIFISLRMLNDYGDPGQWIQYEYVYRTVFSFLNVTKYPMSLEYVLITMSIAFYLLIKIEQGIGKTKTGEILSVFGKVSMFFYLIHLFVIHALAVLVVMATHYKEIPAMVQSNDWDPITNNYGYSLIIVYLVWIAVLTGLYPLCLKYRILKSKHPDSLLKYI